MNSPIEPSDEELLDLALLGLPAARAAEQWSNAAPERQARLAEVEALVAALEEPPPGAVDLVAAVEARIGQRLGRRRRARQAATVIGLAAIACLVLWWSREGDEVRIKGMNSTLETWAGVEVYRLEPKGNPLPLAAALGSKDSLLFAYTNGGQRPFTHLLVFGVASTGQIYWYYPAWQDPADDPCAIAIEPSSHPVELHERIAHDLPPGRFVVHAVFAHRALRVSEVERAAAQADPLGPLPLPETAQQRHVVEVF